MVAVALSFGLAGCGAGADGDRGRMDAGSAAAESATPATLAMCEDCG
jgi:hypothetical protein